MREVKGLSAFERYLSIWVGICILIGIGWLFPGFPAILKRAEVAHVSIPVAVLIWLMIYPMMVQIDFSSIRKVGKQPKGLGLTLIINRGIKPFTMAGISALFLFVAFKTLIPPDLAREHYAGAILLGAAPCTAMVLRMELPIARGSGVHPDPGGGERSRPDPPLRPDRRTAGYDRGEQLLRARGRGSDLPVRPGIGRGPRHRRWGLEEVPIMLTLVAIANRTRARFSRYTSASEVRV